MNLEASISQLRALLGEFSTAEICATSYTYWLSRSYTEERQFDLISPGRQWPYLLSLALTTKEPASPHAIKADTLQSLFDDCNSIFNQYALRQFPAENQSVTQEWVSTRDVTLPTFLDYHNQPVLAQPRQLEQRIRTYLSPFDSSLAELAGITATDTLRISKWLLEELQSRLDRTQQLQSKEREIRIRLLDEATAQNWNKKRVAAESDRRGLTDIIRRLLDIAGRPSEIARSDLAEAFGEDLATSYWSAFCSRRPSKELDAPYPTDRLELDDRHLVEIGEDHAAVPMPSLCLLAPLSRLESLLLESDSRKRYARHRGDRLEEESRNALQSILGPRAKIYSPAFESPDGQNEHDFVAVIDRTAIIAESKATPPREVFRDPDKAYVRIRRDFKSDKGIQGAFDQCARIWKRWSEGETIQLYNRAGDQLTVLQQPAIATVHMICVSRDDYGSLAVDLTRLLELPTKCPYPWATNAFALDSIAQAWRHLGLTPADFLRFLAERSAAQGTAFASDELDIAGAFLVHRSLAHMRYHPDKKVIADPTYSDVFDQIEHSEQEGAAPVRLPPKPPALRTLSNMVAPVEERSPNSPPKRSDSQKAKRARARRSQRAARRRNRRR